MRDGILKNPVFDIHYNARKVGHSATGTEKIRYAQSSPPKHADLYNEIMRSYARVKTLTPIRIR